MDELTKELYKDYVHREIVRTYGQELSKSEMRKILKDCETLARNMTRRKHYVNWSFNCCISGWMCYTNNKNSLTAREKIEMTTKIFTDRKEPRGNDRVFKHFNILGVKFRVAIKERAYRRGSDKRTYLTKNIYYTSMGISYDGIDSKLYTLYWR